MIRAGFIGIDRHQDPSIRDLGGAVRDAQALWAVLGDAMAGCDGVLLVDADATLDGVNRLLGDTLDAATEDDVVFLSFAGHGTPDHRLVLADTQMADLPGTTLGMDSLAVRFKASRARAVVLLLDCCFSGGAPARVLDAGVVARGMTLPLAELAGRGRVLLAASAADQAALEDPQTRHGLFTKAIVDYLLSADGPVSVVRLVDEVVRKVRADAGRLGYQQGPVMFGLVEEELTLPAGRRGPRYLECFPERGLASTSGNFGDLASFALPQQAIAAWQARFPTGLNALQIAAINKHRVLDGSSLTVVAPTSAGKTFIGELAAMKTISEGRKAVFLLPYKALVNEKFEDFSALYGAQLGLRVVRCSGDWQDQVGDVLRGKYDIAFFTYEKFLSMSLAAPSLMHQLGLVVLDEAQFITEPGRGMVVELLLTNLVSLRQRGVSPQLLTLSAVIGDINGFDRWLDCSLLHTQERPVPLTEGVLDRSGAWKYAAAEGREQEVALVDRYAISQRGNSASSQDVIVPLVRKLVAAGEKVIVFRNARGPAAGCAEYLARDLGLAPARKTIDALPATDLSDTSQRLRRSLEGGVAFHSSDLNRLERVAVEQGFRDADGGVHVLVATSTVAAGVNTPASTVVIVESAFPGGTKQPFTVAQYKNMAGRAGRLGFEADGKSVLLADNVFERDSLFRRYVQGVPEPITSSFDPNQPGTWVIKLLAQVQSVPRNAVIDLVANTYGGYLATLRDSTWRARMVVQLEHLLDRMVADQLLEAQDGTLRLTMLGVACGESPFSLESSLRLIEILTTLAPEGVTLEMLLVLVEALPERDEDYTPQAKKGEPLRQQEAAQRFGWEVTRLLRHRASSDFAFYARCKRALVIADWMDGVPVADIERRYSPNVYQRVGHGDIRGYADGSRFLLESVLRIASIVLERADDPEVVGNLLKRLDVGIPAAALALTGLPTALSRGEILGLWTAGIVSRDDVLRVAPAVLNAVLGDRHEVLLANLKAA
ncbi:DEAD/DEAH box helicase [Cupriavidus basilensis]